MTPAKGKPDIPPAKDNLRPRRQSSTNYRVTKKEKNLDKNLQMDGEWKRGRQKLLRPVRFDKK